MPVNRASGYHRAFRAIAAVFFIALLLFGDSFYTQPRLERRLVTLSVDQPAIQPIKEFPIPQNLSYPIGLALDQNGNVWFGEGNTDVIEEFFPANQSFRAFHIPISSQLAFIWTPLFDTRGNLWFTTTNGPTIWRLNTTSGQFASFSTGNPSVQPYTLAYDPVRNQLWFTSFASSQFGVFQLENNGSAALLHIYSLPVPQMPSSGLGAAAIALDNQGNVYVTESYLGQIAKFNESNGEQERFWTLSRGSEPLGIAVSPQTNLIWFTDHATSQFGYINQSSNAVSTFSTSISYYKGNPEISLPYWIYTSSSGMIWFNEHSGNRIARFDPKNLVLTEFAVPTPNSQPIKLALDDQRGLVWFSEFAGNKLGVLPQNTSLDSQVTISEKSLVLSGNSVSFNVSVSSTGGLPLNVSSSASKTGILTDNFTLSSKALYNSEIQLTLGRGSSLAPSNYHLTICTNDTDPARSCAVVLVTVTGSENNIYYSIVIAVGSVAAALAISIFFVRRWQGRVR